MRNITNCVKSIIWGVMLMKNTEFIIGCNYWASNAGTEMWKNYDEKVIRKDLQTLAEYGVKYLRVFPIWRDFQPVIPVMRACATLDEYRLEGDIKSTNPYYLDEEMLRRFSSFCDICEEFGMKLIVGLITGWMSGRTFVPPALFNKDLYTDATALLFEQRLIMGMVSYFKDRKSIWAWDIGNECGVLGNIKSEDAAANWTYIMVNAVRAFDCSRKVITGIHSLKVQPNTGGWSIMGQGECCDLMVTHPYPLWSKYAYADYTASFRTMVFSTFITKMYADISKKPCLVEEIGTMGPMICSDELAADYVRCNMLSLLSNGAVGFMWWCASDQTNLLTYPYTDKMCELELGLMDTKCCPKPALKEMKSVSNSLKKLNFELPKATDDAICILTKDQDNEAAGYMSYALAKQAGLNLGFSYCNDEFPEAKLYIMPSVCGNSIMPRENYIELKRRVSGGATLYISNDNGIFSEFEELTGLQVVDSGKYSDNSFVKLNGEMIKFKRKLRYKIKPTTAKVIAYDDLGIPAITVNKYGNGYVYYVNFPLETMLIDENNAFDTNRYLIYEHLFSENIQSLDVYSRNPNVAVTRHRNENEYYCIAVNYSGVPQKSNLIIDDNFCVSNICYGNLSEIGAFDACIFELSNINRQ